MRRALLAAIPLVLLAQGCAASAARDGGPTGGAGSGGAAGTRDESLAQRYEAEVTVLQDAGHGPELCLGGIRASLPPQCGGIPIPNWSWDAVSGEETRGRTTWGTFRVVGTYDGDTFTVAEATPSRPATEQPQDPPRAAACPAPRAGWPRKIHDPTGTKVQALSELARRAPEFAGLWLTYAHPPAEGTDVGPVVVNAAFTSDLERHEAELRRHWPGPLCVTRHARSYRELARIQNELSGAAGRSLGLEVLRSSVMEVDNVLDAEVVVLDERARKAVEARYGKAVRLTAALNPVGRAAR